VAPLVTEYGPDAEIILDNPPRCRVSLTEAAEMLAAPPWWPAGDTASEPDPAP
jgi:hypothetical protein